MILDVFTPGLIWIFIGVLVLVSVFAFFMWGLKHAIALAINSVIGFFALYAIKFVVPLLTINIWSVALVALFGIFGFALVLLFHGIGIFF